MLAATSRAASRMLATRASPAVGHMIQARSNHENIVEQYVKVSKVEADAAPAAAVEVPNNNNANEEEDESPPQKKKTKGVEPTSEAK
jgi:hypothetical protein